MNPMKPLTSTVVLYQTTEKLRLGRRYMRDYDFQAQAKLLMKLWWQKKIKTEDLPPAFRKLALNPTGYFCRDTYAFTILEGGKIALAWAFQNPLDIFSREKARKIVLGRLMEFLSNPSKDTNSTTITTLEEIEKTMPDSKLANTIKVSLKMFNKRENSSQNPENSPLKKEKVFN